MEKNDHSYTESLTFVDCGKTARQINSRWNLTGTVRQPGTGW